MRNIIKQLVFVFALSLFAFSCSSDEDRNYRDSVDVNNVPAPLEQREEEIINESDIEDENLIPAEEEERLYDERHRYREYLNDDSFLYSD